MLALELREMRFQSIVCSVVNKVFQTIKSAADRMAYRSNEKDVWNFIHKSRRSSQWM
jgi:hypothetical protein